MNELQIFNNEEFGEIRTVVIDGEPWFVGKDVAVALGYKDTKNALKAHVDEEDKTGWQITTPSRGVQTMTVINESGVYSLIFGSKLESAKRFKHWVTSEVLPALRKTGHYEIPGHETKDFEPRTLNTDQVIRIGEIMAGCFKWNVPYVRNILRHIIPDIDEIWEQAADEGMKADESVKTEVKPQPQNHSDIRKGYAKPFNDKKFNEYLWERRIPGKWLEEQIGCSEGCVSKWRSGKVAPGNHYRVLICKVLEVPEGYFDKRVRRKKG